MVEMRGILDDLVTAMLNAGLAKDDEADDTIGRGTRPKGPEVHERKWTLVFSIKVARFDTQAEAEAELAKASGTRREGIHPAAMCSVKL
jgi:hypothetical protein